VDELDSIREQLPSPTSTLNETSPSTNVVTSPDAETTTVEAQRTPFSPFTPNTFDELKSEIKRNSENLDQLDSVTDPAVLGDVKENLLDEKRFFLTQQTNHLEAVVEQARSIELNDVDMDDLLKKVEELKSNVDRLSKDVESIKHRALENNDK